MIKKFIVLLLVVGMIAALAIGLLVGGVYRGYFGALPDHDDLMQINNETASLVYSEDKQLIGKYFAKNRTNAAYEDFPTHLVNALIATEDARFFEHDGVDYRSLMRVFFKTLLMGEDRSGGGSTISQQLAKNLYSRSYRGVLALPVNKVKEFILAGRLSEIYTKNDILTLYLNTVPFGENVYGIEAAAMRFFNRSASKLTIEQSAVLIGMLKANTYYNPRLNPENSLHRRNVVLSQMEKYDYIDAVANDSLKNLPLELDYAELASESPANYFLVQVKREAFKILNSIETETGTLYDIEKDGLIINTTLNHKMQLMALEAFSAHLGKMQPLLHRLYSSGLHAQEVRQMAERRLGEINKKQREEKRRRELFSWDGYFSDSINMVDSVIHDLTLLHAGMIAMDPFTGAVKTWVGGIDFRYQPYDQVLARRQVASTFKPILYAAALESGITPCTYLSNDTIVFGDHENWSPSNYDHSTGGKYSMAGALAKSMNIPSVDLLYHFDRAVLEQLWKDLGFGSALPNGPSTALGSADANVLELAVAYSAFANGGKKISPIYISSITTAEGMVLYEMETPVTKQIMSEDNALLMQQLMQKVVNEGTASRLRSTYGLREELAAKTGTSQDYADAWFGGFTPALVMVSRVGASMPAVHFDGGNLGSGSALAMPLVAMTLQQVKSDSELRKSVFLSFPEVPEHLAGILDCADYLEPTTLDGIRDLFRSKMTTEEKKQQRRERRENRRKEQPEKKGGLLQQLFGKKNKN